MRCTPQPEKYHEEGDVFEHTMMVLDEARQKTNDPSILFAALYHDVGKTMTPSTIWPSHHGHGELGHSMMPAIADSIKMDSKTTQRAAMCAAKHMGYHRAMEMRPGSVVKLLLDLKVQHRPDLLEALLIVGEADALGRIPADFSSKDKKHFLRNAAAILRSIKMEPSDRPLENRLQILTQRRVNAVKQLRKQYD